MSYKKTLAQNHLSKYGRFGDTEMAESKYVSPGSLWHVNEKEKALMNRGEGGERIVDALGSGTFNPVTGKEEKWIFTALSVGLGLAQGIQGAGASRDQARAERKLEQEKIKGAHDAIEALGDVKQSQVKTAFSQFGEASKSAGLEKEQITESFESAAKKSGLVTAAGLEQKKSGAWNQFAMKSKGIYSKLGETMGKIEGFMEGEVTKLQDVIKSSRTRIGLLNKQADKKFLGIW
jgi:hypothetical protein